jgi:hypothetical protein
MRGKLGHPIWTYTHAKTLDFPRTPFSHQDYAANNRFNILPLQQASYKLQTYSAFTTKTFSS